MNPWMKKMDESYPTLCANLNRFDFPALWGEVLESLIVHARDRYMLTPWYFEDLWHLDFSLKSGLKSWKYLEWCSGHRCFPQNLQFPAIGGPCRGSLVGELCFGGGSKGGSMWVEDSNRGLQQELCPGKFLMVWFVVYQLYKCISLISADGSGGFWSFTYFHIVSHVPRAIDFSLLLSEIQRTLAKSREISDDVWASPRTICLQSCSSNLD